MSKKVNILGQKFGRLTVVGECEERTKQGQLMYKCKCECGNIKNIRGYTLRNGGSKSCGCLNKINHHKTHGKTHTRLYSIFCDMKKRCHNKNNKEYHNYGGRGIIICEEWLNDFMNFYNWAINNGYDDNLTIDRIDVNGNYEPSNCRWVDIKSQCNNTRKNVYLTYNGKTQTMSQWADELCIPVGRVKTRHKRGWSDKECLFGKEV